MSDPTSPVKFRTVTPVSPLPGVLNEWVAMSFPPPAGPISMAMVLADAVELARSAAAAIAAAAMN